MMMLYRLVRLIETHSQSLASCLLDQVESSELAKTYQRNVPGEELREKVYEIYRHLGEWLIAKDETDLQSRYLQIGARRANQRVPLSEVIWVIVLTKENLWEFVKKKRSLSAPSRSLVNLRCCSYWSSSLIARFISPPSVTNSRSPIKCSGKSAPSKSA